MHLINADGIVELLDDRFQVFFRFGFLTHPCNYLFDSLSKLVKSESFIRSDLGKLRILKVGLLPYEGSFAKRVLSIDQNVGTDHLL